MRHQIEIEFKKIKKYRTFWVIGGLYFITLTATTASGMEFLKWLKRTFENFGGDLNINRIPLYHFPDIWQNLIWVSGLFKIIIAIWVVISITNEYQYRTLRQNIIDGMSRWEFLLSKILMNAALSLASMVVVGLICLLTGLIYTPHIVLKELLTDIEFLPAYFLEIFAFLSFALLLGVLVRRSGLTIILLLLSSLIELIVKENIDNYVPYIIDYFPLESISNVVSFPFPRYAFQKIQNDVSLLSVAVALTWTFVFNWISYMRLKKMDM